MRKGEKVHSGLTESPSSSSALWETLRVQYSEKTAVNYVKVLHFQKSVLVQKTLVSSTSPRGNINGFE